MMTTCADCLYPSSPAACDDMGLGGLFISLSFKTLTRFFIIADCCAKPLAIVVVGLL
jgi:hypothetical protein